MLFRPRLHVVAEVVEAELACRAVHNVAGVRSFLLFVTLHVMRMNCADREAECAEEGERPIAVALHEVIVHRDDVHLLLLARREIAGERADDRLTFAGLHFGDLAFSEHDAADQLNVERTRAEGWARLWIDRAYRVVNRWIDVEVLPAFDHLRVTAEFTLGVTRLERAHGGERCVVLCAHVGGKQRRIEQILRVDNAVLIEVDAARGIEDVADADRAIHRLAGHREDLGNHRV